MRGGSGGRGLGGVGGLLVLVGGGLAHDRAARVGLDGREGRGARVDGRGRRIEVFGARVLRPLLLQEVQIRHKSDRVRVLPRPGLRAA